MSNSIQRHPLGLTWIEDDGHGAAAAHALRADGRVWLVDPFEDPIALSAATELGSPAAVIQLLDRHNRDCGAIAQRLEVPLLRLPEQIDDSPFVALATAAGGTRWPCGGGRARLMSPRRSAPCPRSRSAAGVGVHPLLLAAPARGPLYRSLAQRLLFLGHAPPLNPVQAAAIRDALSGAVTDIPQLVLKLPSLVRGT